MNGPVDGFVDMGVCTHDLPYLFVTALGDQVLVDFTEGGEEAVGVISRKWVTVVRHGQAVVRDVVAGDRCCPHSAVHVSHRNAFAAQHEVNGGCVRSQHPHRDCPVGNVRAKDLVGLRVGAIDEGVDHRVVDSCWSYRCHVTPFLGALARCVRTPGWGRFERRCEGPTPKSYW